MAIDFLTRTGQMCDDRRQDASVGRTSRTKARKWRTSACNVSRVRGPDARCTRSRTASVSVSSLWSRI